jgi:hypothetical protein
VLCLTVSQRKETAAGEGRVTPQSHGSDYDHIYPLSNVLLFFLVHSWTQLDFVTLHA